MRQHADQDLRLIVFDVDGTLLDSAAGIVGCATRAFVALGLPEPEPIAIRRIMGLSLEEGFDRVTGGALPGATIEALAARYREEAHKIRAAGGLEGSATLFPGARDALERLHRDPPTLLGIATGKGRPGLDHMLDGHGLRAMFVTAHCASDHPGKPHPSMLEAALRDTGVARERSVMIGDTSYDVEMALNAGMRAVGVAWGSHEADELIRAGAHSVIDAFEALDAALIAALATEQAVGEPAAPGEARA